MSTWLSRQRNITNKNKKGLRVSMRLLLKRWMVRDKTRKTRLGKEFGFCALIFKIIAKIPLYP